MSEFSDLVLGMEQHRGKRTTFNCLGRHGVIALPPMVWLWGLCELPTQHSSYSLLSNLLSSIPNLKNKWVGLPSSTVDGNVDGCSHYGEQYGGSLKK